MRKCEFSCICPYIPDSGDMLLMQFSDVPTTYWNHWLLIHCAIHWNIYFSFKYQFCGVVVHMTSENVICVCSRVSKWGRLYADVSIWGGSRVETSSSGSQYMRFRPFIDTIECGLVGKTSWMPRITDSKFISYTLSMHALMLIKCVMKFNRNLMSRSHEKSATSRLGKCWGEQHNTV